jgi:predicted choloylglycine hydrolase
MLSLQGSRFELGLQHGEGRRDAIQAFLADRTARIDALMPPTAVTRRATEIEQYRSVIAQHLPGMYEEIRGLAEGAQISVAQALLLQLRRELVGFTKIPSGGDCTTFGRRQDGHTVLGQTIDINGDMERELTALRINHANGRSVLLASFTGLLGYLGMNDHGLGICLNLVLGGQWGPGIPGYMAIRHLLDEASNVDECLAILHRLPLASSRALTICDRERLVTVEYIRNEMCVLEAPVLIHTNHFLDAQWAGRDELNPFARTSSMRRFEACRSGLEKITQRACAQQYFDLLGAAPIYVPANGDVRRECTVGAVLMRLEDGEMIVRKGDPAIGASQTMTCQMQG